MSGCFQGKKVMIRCERPVGDLEKLRQATDKTLLLSIVLVGY